jgi:transcription elongation factor Elf1
MIEISKHKIDIKCPKCNNEIKITLGQVGKGETVICDSCHSSIKLVDNNNSTKQGINDINKAFSSLEKTLKSLGKKR